MFQTIKRSLQNGLIFIEDIAGGEPPYPVTDAKVQFTASCISVACLHEVDGEAELVLGPSDAIDPGYTVAFNGDLDTPSKELMISTVAGEVLLRTEVPTIRTRVQIWRSHPDWPEQVIVGWTDSGGGKV